MSDETYDECVDRKVEELIEEEDMDQDQAVAVASSICETSCSSKSFHPLRNDKFRKRYGKIRDKQARREEQEVRKGIVDYFEDQRDKILEKIEQSQGTPAFDELLSREEEENEAREVIRPIIERVLINSGQSTVEFARSFIKQPPEDFIVDVEIETWLAERSELFATQITETTFNELREVFKEAFDSDNPRKELISGVEQSYEGYTTHRAETIARTETHGAFQKGNFEGYRQANVPTKIWVAVLDGATRDSHAGIDGEEVPTDQPFSNGLMFPGDPSGPAREVVNCRCQM